MSNLVVLAAALIAASSLGHAQGAEGKTAVSARCTSDELVHVQVNPAITKEIKNSIQLLEPGAQLREAAKLILPCGFRVDPRYGWNLFVTNGKEIRRYLENNPIGFAPAFGFGREVTNSYTLSYRVVSRGELRDNGCTDRLKGLSAAPQLCSGAFGAYPNRRNTLIAHYGVYEPPKTRVTHWIMRERLIEPGFVVAAVEGQVESMFFLPPPDAPGGTITLIFKRHGGTFRVYLDTPSG
jgi:hypothetical protein